MLTRAEQKRGALGVSGIMRHTVQQRMSLSPGVRLGPYEIVALVGAGGMGEVYRARDSRLVRDVAVKVLPAAFSSDADRPAPRHNSSGSIELDE